MKVRKFILTAFCLLAALAAGQAAAQTPPKVDRDAAAKQVKAEFMHAWNGYKTHCWGHDDL